MAQRGAPVTRGPTITDLAGRVAAGFARDRRPTPDRDGGDRPAGEPSQADQAAAPPATGELAPGNAGWPRTATLAFAALASATLGGASQAYFTFGAWLSAFVTAAALIVVAYSRSKTVVAAACISIAIGEIILRFRGDALPILFHQTGKLALIGFALILFLRGRIARPPLLPVLFLLLLFPSISVAAENMSTFGDFRRQVSHNLLGHIALVAVTICFFKVTFTGRQTIQLLTFGAILGMINVGWAMPAIARRSSAVLVGTESNFVGAGGAGPNQVSAVQSLGAVFAFLVLMLAVRRKSSRLVFVGIVFAITTAATVITMSRTGPYLVAVAATAAAAGLLLSPRHFPRSALYFGGVVLIALVAFTAVEDAAPNVTARLSETYDAGRVGIAARQVEALIDNPLLGVGPGGTHDVAGIQSHTEPTRMLAEHGVFGAVSLVLLLLWCTVLLLTSRNPTELAVRLAFISWGLAFMLPSGTRMCAYAVLIGLAAARFDSPTADPPTGQGARLPSASAAVLPSAVPSRPSTAP
jgi:hypothetical protein